MKEIATPDSQFAESANLKLNKANRCWERIILRGEKICLRVERRKLLGAKEIGIYLIEAREEVWKAGQPWLPFLDQFHGGQRNAYNYMDIAARWRELEPHLAKNPNLSIDAALNILKKPGSADDKTAEREINAFTADFRRAMMRLPSSTRARLRSHRDWFFQEIEEAALSCSWKAQVLMREHSKADIVEMQPVPTDDTMDGGQYRGVSRAELLNDLEEVQAGLSSHEFLEQSSCFCFQDGHVMTFNDEVACRKATAFHITGAFDGRMALDLLRATPDDILRVHETENACEFSGKDTSFTLTKDSQVFLPFDKVETPSAWLPLAKGLLQAVKRVRPFVGDESRFLLTCIHIHPDHVEACDNIQTMRVKIKTGLDRPILVRGETIEHVTALNVNQIALTKSWVHFRNDCGLTFSCRCFSEAYPKLDMLHDFKGHLLKIPAGLEDACKRVKLSTKGTSGDSILKVTLDKGTIEIKCSGKLASSQVRKKVEYKGPAMTFVIAPQLLEALAKEYSEVLITDNRIKVVGHEWQYVTCLGEGAQEKEAA